MFTSTLLLLLHQKIIEHSFILIPFNNKIKKNLLSLITFYA